MPEPNKPTMNETLRQVFVGAIKASVERRHRDSIHHSDTNKMITQKESAAIIEVLAETILMLSNRLNKLELEVEKIQSVVQLLNKPEDGILSGVNNPPTSLEP